MTTSTTLVPNRRRREGKTDYRKRLSILYSGKPRLIVRKTGHNIIAQVATYQEKGDRVICSAHSRELLKHGWKGSRKSIPAAYLTGLLTAIKARKLGTTQAILDIGLFRGVHGSRLFACLAGAIDGGLQIPHDKKALPSQERLNGEHIQSYGERVQREAPSTFSTRFSITPSLNLTTQVTAVKQKITSMKV